MVGIVGAVIGSFINVVVVRLRARLTLWGRSACPECKQRLAPHHLIPVLSWVLLRGRCAYCHKRIHIQYPLVEILMACLAIGAYLQHGLQPGLLELWSLVFDIVFFAVLLTLAVFDARWKLLPIEVMTASVVIFAMANVLRHGPSVPSMVIGALVGAVFFGFQVVVSKGRWMGKGDPLLAVLIGTALGWPLSGYALYFTYMGGGLVMLVLWLFGLVKHGSRVPFAPWLALGAVLATWFGPALHASLRYLWT